MDCEVLASGATQLHGMFLMRCQREPDGDRVSMPPQVLFSSSIMYGNYMTIKQRRLLAQQEAENTHRIRMVQVGHGPA